MTFEIYSDTSKTCFEVVCRDKRFADYPGGANPNRWGTGWYVPISKNHWYDDLFAIASWVNNNLRDRDGTPEECLFVIG